MPPLAERRTDVGKQTPEGKVKKAVQERLEHYGVLPFTKAADAPGRDVVGMYWMPVQAQFSVHGPHDFCGCWNGVFWSLETKAPENKEDATAPQEAFRCASLRTGGISFVGVRDASAVDELAKLIFERTAS